MEGGEHEIFDDQQPSPNGQFLILFLRLRKPSVGAKREMSLDEAGLHMLFV